MEGTEKRRKKVFNRCFSLTNCEADIKEERTITMAKLCMAHTSTHGARKPLGPIKKERRKSVITMAALANATTGGTHQMPRPKVVCPIN